MDFAFSKQTVAFKNDLNSNSFLFLNRIYFKSLCVFISAFGSFASTMIHASALEQSGQSILPFLENGNYAEANIFAIDSSVSGIVNDRADLVRDHQSRDTGDIAESTQFYTAALKLQLTDRLSFGVLYDQPFSADIKYPARSNNSYFDNDISHEGTSVKADTQNLSLLFGYSPYQHFQIYGGPVYQTVKANVALRGNAYTQAFNGYNAKFKQQGEVGWLLGGSYQLPDIALKAAITYRSKIKYQFQVEEDIFGEPLKLVENEKTKLETPASLNIDFQTGISEKSLVYMNLRWVNWKEFETRPPQYGALSEILMKELTNGEYIQGFKLDSYQNDQYSATLGIAHQFTEKWSTSTDVSWDSGTGNPASTMGPIKGSWSLGLGVQFNPAKNYFITGSLKYFWLGDTKTEDGTYYLPIAGIKPYAEQANFKNNHAIAYGLKFGYWF